MVAYRIRAGVLAGVAAFAIPAGVAAQTGNSATAAPSAAAAAPIVVTGRELSTKQAVRRLTRTVSAQVDGQLARFGEAACPSTAGLPPDYGQIVSDRIRADAQAAGIALAAPGCRPNLVVMFVENGQDIVRQIRRDSPSAFGAMSSGDIDRLARDAGPVHAWMATEVRNEDGQPAVASAVKGGPSLAPTLSVHTASIMNPSSQQAIVGSVLLFDNAATIGKTLDQLADYAAMRTLAQTSDRRTAAGDDTILTLFAGDGGTAPASLTTFDRAYLRSLYSGSGLRTYFSKVGTIATAINKAGGTARVPDAAAGR